VERGFRRLPKRTAPTEGMPRLPGVTRSRHGAARDKGYGAGRQPQAPREPGRVGVRSSPRRVGARLEVPCQAVDGCARPEPSGGVGFTQGLSGLKRVFEFPMLRIAEEDSSALDIEAASFEREEVYEDFTI